MIVEWFTPDEPPRLTWLGLSGEVLARMNAGQISAIASFVGPPGSGDMHRAVYDPTSRNSDAFARANHTGTQTLSTISDAGTAAGLDVAAAGDAAAGEVVKGDDTRLTDARTPTTHTHVLADITDAGTAAALNTGTASGQIPVLGTGGKLPAVDGSLLTGLASGLLSDFQEFTSSGTWTKPVGAAWVYVEVIGGGGSGGRSASTTNGGGGGGAFVGSLFRASDLSGTVTVTIGAGGAAKASDGAGNNGGNTTFGAHVTANGGIGGSAVGGRGGGGQIGTNGPGPAGYASGAGSRGSSTGGYSTKGGGGGGGASGVGGGSTDGGAGGAGSLAGTATSGSVPGGGGGGTQTGTSGAGAAGRVRVWAW